MGQLVLSLRRRPVTALLLWFLLVLAPLGLAANENRPLVRRIEVRTDLDLQDASGVRRLIEIREGEPLDPSMVRQTLRNLEASDRFAEAEVWSRPEAGGVVIVVAFQGSTRVETVDFEGVLELGREDLEAVVEQKAGQQLIEGRVLRSVFALQDLYESEGFSRARVRVDVETEPQGYTSRVVFQVDPGPRRRVGSVTVAGVEGLSPKEIHKLLGLKQNRPYRVAQARDAVEKLGDWLRADNYLSAEVRLEEAIVGADHSVDLEYVVDRGPQCTFEVIGWPETRLRKAGLLPTVGPEEGDDAVLRRTEARIRTYLQGRGYYQNEVQATVDSPTSGVDLPKVGVTIHVEPGPEFRVTDVSFQGNEAFDDERLSALMQTSPFSPFVLGSGRLVDSLLDEDLEGLESFYALSGWLWAEVGPARVVENPGEKPEDKYSLRIEIPIVEGMQSRVVGLRVIGADELGIASVSEVLALEAGGPYHPQRLEESLDRIRALYESSGYAGALVTAETDPSDDGTLVDLDFTIQEGTQQRLDRVIVRGSRRLAVNTVLGVSGLTRSEPLSRGRLIEAQQALYRLGIFSRVVVELAPVGDDPAHRDVVIRLTEGDEQRFVYGLGYDSEEGLGGVAGYTHRNLWGKAIRFQVDLRAAESSEDYRLLLSRSFWRKGRLPGSQKLHITSLDEQRTSFDVDQRGLEVELGWDRARSRYSLFFDYRPSDLTLADDVVLVDADLPDGSDGRDLQDIDILSVTPRYGWDGRDDPIDPTRGSIFSAQAEYAVPVDGISTEDFVKVFGLFAQYWPLRRAGVLAFSLRGGFIEPLGDASVSIAERFFAGGSTTHRAYDRDELGIPGATLDSRGNPVGGNGMIVANLDWRFPIVGSFGGTLFADFGNVWSDWRDIQPEEGKAGVGIGARYASPIGPLRLDIAWKLDREPDESETQVFFAFGYAF